MPRPAPPPLSKPPRLLRFVEATQPASLAAEERADVAADHRHRRQGARQPTSPSPSRRLRDVDQAAVAAARQFTFEPGEAAGKPVPVRITYAYHFAPKPPPSRRRAAVAGARAGAHAPLDGIVLRKGDRVPIPGVAVVARAPPRAVTGDDGRFSFDALPAGALTLQLRSPTTSPPTQRHAHARQAAVARRSTSTRRSATPRSCAGGARGRDGRADLAGRGDQVHPRHAGRHAQGGAELARRGARPLRDRSVAGVGIVARRLARLSSTASTSPRCTTSEACARR